MNATTTPANQDAPPKPESEATLAAPSGSASTDVIKSALPKKENHELAEDLLARFPGVDRAELLKDMASHLQSTPLARRA